MPDSIKFSIDGIDVINKILKDLPKIVSEKVQSDINRAGAVIVQKALQQAAPDGNNNKKSKNKIASNVIIKKGAGSSWQIGFSKRGYAVRFIEKGTKVRYTKGKGRYKRKALRGTMTRKPFVKATHERIYPTIVSYLSANYLKLVNKSIKRQLNKVKKANSKK